MSHAVHSLMQSEKCINFTDSLLSFVADSLISEDKVQEGAAESHSLYFCALWNFQVGLDYTCQSIQGMNISFESDGSVGEIRPERAAEGGAAAAGPTGQLERSQVTNRFQSRMIYLDSNVV